MVHAIIVAAGASLRTKGAVKKQFAEILGAPVIVHTLNCFIQSQKIDTIICVIAKDDIPFFNDLIKSYSLSKIETVVAGGATRQESVAAGLSYLEKHYSMDDWVAVHDGARPLVTVDLIERVIAAAAESGGAIAAIPATDSLKEVVGYRVVKSIPRETTWAAQTPQVFRLGILIEAMKKASQDSFFGTDEAALVERISGTVVCVESNDNIKITTSSDLKRAEIILGSR